MLLFIDRMESLYEEMLRSHGLSERCAGILPVGFGFADVLSGFDASVTGNV
jgi:hypothetical protein